MKNKLIAQRYARAIIGNIDEKLFASAINDISSLKKIFLQFSEITKKIDSYLYPFIERKKIAGEIAKELENKKLWKNLFELLVQKHKFSIIPDILIELENMILEINNQVKVTLKIAHELSDDAIERIESVIKDIIQKEIIFDVVIEPEILGGFVAETETKLIDGSIRNNLIKFKNIINK